MPLDSEPHDWHNYSWNWVMVCKTTKRGGVMGKYPPCQDSQQINVFYPDEEHSHPIEEGPLPPIGGWLYTLTSPSDKYQYNFNTGTRWQPEHEDVPTKWGVDCKECPTQNIDCNRLLFNSFLNGHRTLFLYFSYLDTYLSLSSSLHVNTITRLISF